MVDEAANVAKESRINTVRVSHLHKMMTRKSEFCSVQSLYIQNTGTNKQKENNEQSTNMFPVHTMYNIQYYSSNLKKNSKLYVQIKPSYCKGNEGVFTPIALEQEYSKSPA